MNRLASLTAALSLSLCLCLAPDAARAAEEVEPARQVVDRALREVVAILNDTDASSESRRRRIEEVAYAHFDFDTMSRLVIARPWRKFTPEQKTRFIEEFKKHLSRSYGRRLERYEQTGVEVTGEVQEPRGDVTVKTQVVGGQYSGAMVNYRMRKKDGRWQVIDVVIEGVSLVSNFRSQFAPIVRQGGAEELLSRLNDKNEVLQAEIESEASSTVASDPVAE